MDPVLTDVNMLRATLGRPPLARLPKGIRRDTERCVIARSFSDCGASVFVTGGMIAIRNDDYAWVEVVGHMPRTVVISTPQYLTMTPSMSAFVGSFDMHEYVRSPLAAETPEELDALVYADRVHVTIVNPHGARIAVAAPIVGYRLWHVHYELDVPDPVPAPTEQPAPAEPVPSQPLEPVGA